MKNLIKCQNNLIEDILTGELSLTTLLLAVECYIQIELALYPLEYNKFFKKP